jgi:hypothetical protein
LTVFFELCSDGRDANESCRALLVPFYFPLVVFRTYEFHID